MSKTGEARRPKTRTGSHVAGQPSPTPIFPAPSRLTFPDSSRPLHRRHHRKNTKVAQNGSEKEKRKAPASSVLVARVIDTIRLRGIYRTACVCGDSGVRSADTSTGLGPTTMHPMAGLAPGPTPRAGPMGTRQRICSRPTRYRHTAIGPQIPSKHAPRGRNPRSSAILPSFLLPLKRHGTPSSPHRAPSQVAVRRGRRAG